MPVRKTTEEVIDRFRSLHGDRYDYSLVEYHNSSSKVTVICKLHGSFLDQGHEFTAAKRVQYIDWWHVRRLEQQAHQS